MASKYVDTISVMQVIGCCYNNPSLLDLTDKYTIVEEDFVQDFHKVVFGSILKLHNLGVEKITLENISDFLSSRPKSEAIFKLHKGEEWLIKISEKALSSSFDYYYQRLKKFTLLREYDKFGVDVSDIYDPDNLMDVRKKQVQEEYLDNNSLVAIADRIDNKISEIRMRYAEGDYNQALSAGEGIDTLIDRFKQHPEVGIPLYGSLVNTITRGARLKKFYLRSAGTGMGKAIPNSTLIPTPIGQRKVGDIKVGDYLFGQDGKPTKVLAVYPQSEKKQVWKVTFESGRTAECCDEHLWSFYDTSYDKLYTKSLKEIYKESQLNNFKYFGEYCYRVPIAEPVELPVKKYNIDPYVFGLLLSNGVFMYGKNGKDNKLARDIMKAFDFKELLKDYPELWECNKYTKFIPQTYLYGSIKQRLKLLRGLMGSNGSFNSSNGRITYTTVSSRLKDNFMALLTSLGMPFYLHEECKSSEQVIYYIDILIDDDKKECLFYSKEKKQLIKKFLKTHSTIQNENKKTDPIIKIEPLNEKTDMTCFTVDNRNHLFIAGSTWWVTHNTRAMIADVCYIGCDEIYDERFGWIRTGPGQPALYISTEMELEEAQTMMISFLSNVNEEHILNGEITEEEEERCRKAVELLKKAPIYIEELPDFSLQDVENTIKRNIRDNEIRYVFDSK